jgi:hypothetical protein
MNKKEILNTIKKAALKNDVDVNVTINGVDFDMLGYDESDDVIFLFSTEHDIECELDENTRMGDLLNIIEIID